MSSWRTQSRSVKKSKSSVLIGLDTYFQGNKHFFSILTDLWGVLISDVQIAWNLGHISQNTKTKQHQNKQERSVGSSDDVQIAWKIVLCTTEQTFGILYQKKLGKASHFLPFEIKSLLTLVLGNLCKYNLPVNNSKHLLYLLNLYITVNSLAYHYHILHVK
jgi:hypothetical protein